MIHIVTLKQFRDEWLKLTIGIDSISFGKIDANKEQTMCIYDNAGDGSPLVAVGGLDATGYGIKSMKILIRWTKNKDTAETFVQDVFSKLLTASFFIAGKRCFVQMMCPEPISLDTDNHGVYEYALKFNLVYER